MRRFQVKEKDTLLAFLFKILPDTKKTRIKQMLKYKSVRVNDKPVTRFDHPLKPGDEVGLSSAKSVSAAGSPRWGVEIIYEDDDVIVIQKPSGLLSVASEKVQDRTAIYAVNAYLNAQETEQKKRTRGWEGSERIRRKQVFIVHRLDQDASGLMVLAKNEAVKRLLQDHWKQVRKKYYAVVEGVPKKMSGTVTSYLRENKFLKVYSSKREEGARHSTTHYQVLRSTPHYSLIEVELDTGRKHQIRVHLSDLGCPIAGDDRYESKTNPSGRLMLHAFYLEFKHPVTEKPLCFQTPLPASFEKVLNEADGISLTKTMA